ncbi:hypothetical protein B0H16DRAFT_1735660 [Mycena metata]|uniref:Uncharacterized protein n=1 Tax=Mycena metata TaxID=1033252 RepID=A0AAD7HSQ5_9AGAR|nr:hypothetical protein B0H16DRAFT_1735660 [Mycena metata]
MVSSAPRINLCEFKLTKQNKKNKNDPPKPKLKPGNKGNFHGKRYDFLVNYLEGYLEALRNSKTRDWWSTLFEEYWQLFDWRLALNEEPGDDAMVLVGGQEEQEELSEEEMDRKTKVQEQIKSKIKTWYNHHRNALGLASNPYTPWLARLRRPEEACPKRVTEHQFYMQHDDHKARVESEFQSRHWDAPRKNHLTLWCGVARELFEAEPEEVKARIRQEARQEHKEQVALWKDAAEGLPSANEEDQKEARVRFSAVVAPLLHSLREFTGYHITLVAGRVTDDGKVDVISVHAGKTKAKTPDKALNLTQWDKEGYKNIFLNQFVRFLAVANREPSNEPQNDATNNPTPADPTAPPVPVAMNNPAPTDPTAPPVLIVSPTIPPDPSSIHPTVDSSIQPPEIRHQEMLSQGRESTLPLAGSLEARMAALKVLESPLWRELEAMDEAGREGRVAQLEGLSEMTLKRENKLARNREGAKAVSGARLESAAKGSTGKNPRKRARKAKGAKAKRPRQSGNEEEEGSAVSSDSDASEGEGRAEPPQTHGRRRRIEADDGSESAGTHMDVDVDINSAAGGAAAGMAAGAVAGTAAGAGVIEEGGSKEAQGKAQKKIPKGGDALQGGVVPKWAAAARESLKPEELDEA